jgi:hypothetical protein
MTQLVLPLRAPEIVFSDRYVVTRALKRHQARADVEARLQYCLTFFPELHGRSFGVGITKQALGLASLEEFTIWLNPTKLCLHTVTHELTHLCQSLGLVPEGERACDLHALSRDPSLNDSRPNYLDIPDTIFDEKSRPRRGWARVMHESASEALRRRSRGLRTYIRWFEGEMALLASGAAVEGGCAR